MKMTRGLKFLGVGLATILLVSCAVVEETYDKVVGNTYKPTVCPRVSILADASELTAFKPGPGRDIIDTTLEGKITGVDVRCGYDLEEDRSGELNVSVVLHFQASLGAAKTSNSATLPYFLAVVDQKKNVLKRDSFNYTIQFRGNMVKAAYQDEPVQFILPLRSGEVGSAFEIYTGFQLTKDQLAYNRRKKNR